ncbi:hypothetical protein L1889_13205 [Paenalcaligenes niemegkensis]|uniref:hypothetical protein n=1 Tax=Paenalcaligenes niemegkensis TaxID=2895469 RepID=UPI001EE83F44|nr:hypothetical protein [Paenalcaligenes niemegkensis]MCQ9617521.1 hypothetical protein [Paenalcaligenes niemegkensis]
MSTMTTYSHYIRWSDSLERDVMQKALDNGESVSITELAVNVVNFIKRAATGIMNYVVALTEALNEARARDAHFTSSGW